MTTMQTKEARAVFMLCRSEIGLSFDADTAEELCESLESSNDFTLEIDGGEYRFIAETHIRATAQEEMWQTIEECYLSSAVEGGNGLPWWIDIDEEQTVQNCIDADGYGHHFSGYDGNEYETGDWYVFRTN